MISFFTTPKPFRGRIKTIQYNAIRSWLALKPECEVILLGTEEGNAEAAAELGIKHIPEAEYNEYGTPLVNSLFRLAEGQATHEIMCFISTDIILTSGFAAAVQSIKHSPFLMVGRRWDLDLDEEVDFDDSRWESRLKDITAAKGILHPPTAIDYFVYTRGMYRNMPPFAAGRAGIDNWLIFQARFLKVKVIDATAVVTAIHQNHDYSHHPQGAAGVWEGPERKKNIELMGGPDHGFTTEYATRVLTPQGLKVPLSPRRLYFRLSAVPVLVPRLHFLNSPVKALTRLIIKIKSFF